jgi:hypothetical protein
MLCPMCQQITTGFKNIFECRPKVDLVCGILVWQMHGQWDSEYFWINLLN